MEGVKSQNRTISVRMKKQDWHHHLLPLALVEGPKEAGDEHVELPDLLLVVVLQRVLVTLLQPREGCAHLMLVLKTEKTELRVRLFLRLHCSALLQ